MSSMSSDMSNEISNEMPTGMPNRIPPSGFYYPNRFVRQVFDAATEIIGQPAFEDVLRQANLEFYIGKPPPENLARAVDFAEFSALCGALYDLPDGEVLTEQIGYRVFRLGLGAFGSMAGIGGAQIGLRSLPLTQQCKLGLWSLIAVFNSLSDQRTELIEHAEHFDYVLHRCPICWGRTTDRPVCRIGAAMIVEGLLWVTKRRVEVHQTHCHAMGDAACIYRVEKLKGKE